MDAAQIQALLTGILGTGGIGTLLGLWVVRRSRNAGVPSDEAAAKVALSTPDWTALTEYYKNELESVRREAADEAAALRAELGALRIHYQTKSQADEERIDELEEHIYMQRPPPPPARRRTEPGAGQG